MSFLDIKTIPQIENGIAKMQRMLPDEGPLTVPVSPDAAERGRQVLAQLSDADTIAHSCVHTIPRMRVRALRLTLTGKIKVCV
jgi:hypothetical protein